MLVVGRRMGQAPLQHACRDSTQLPLNSFFIALGNVFHLCAFGVVGRYYLIYLLISPWFCRTLLQQCENCDGVSSIQTTGLKHIASLISSVPLEERKEGCGGARNWDRDNQLIQSEPKVGLQLLIKNNTRINK